MKKRILSAFLALLMCGSTVTPAFAMPKAEKTPIPVIQNATQKQAAERQILNFNKDWRFQLGEVKGGEAEDFDDSDWRVLNLPHDYSIENDFNVNSEAKAGGGFLDGGIAWYRKTWLIPADMAGKRISIDFDGAYMNSSIYVNGTLVGEYPYGYSPFSYDITDYVAADGITENVIAVRTNNVQPSSRWYSGSGIYRDVELTVTDPVHVDRYGTKITTPDLEKEYTQNQPATVYVDTKIANDGNTPANITVRHTAYFEGSLTTPGSLDPKATAATQPAAVAPGEVETVKTKLSIPSPHLWKVGDGGMYTLRTEVLKDGIVIDTYETDFGLRWMEFNPQKGFFLNGEYTKMYGVCQHHDQGAMGAVNNQTALNRQMRILREMGVNSIRSSHNPASRAMLNACNEQGIMVMNEAFDTWYDGKNLYDFHTFFDSACTHPDAEEGQTWQEFDIKNMVEGSKNDPSIVMWSIGNEIQESWSAKGLEVGAQLRKWVEEVDDTRVVTQADPIFYNLNKPAYDPANNQEHWQLINGHGAMGFNYGTYEDYDYVHEKNPDWFIYSSETSSAVSTRGAYFHPEEYEDHDASLHKGSYQCSEFDNDHVNWGTSLHDALLGDAQRKYMGGLFFWTGFDYIGEPAPFAKGSSKGSYFGAIDTCGFPKDSFYLIQSQWMDVKTDPMVHILPHWNWEDDRSIDINGETPIRIYSNARSVEIFLNKENSGVEGLGESLGKKEFTYYPETETSLARQDNGDLEKPRLYLQWTVPFEAGTITAIAYDENGDEIARDTKTTAGKPAALKMMPETKTIKADGEDLCYIAVDVVDENGVMNPRANNPIEFSISGDGRIVGTDNGDQTDFTNMKSTSRSAFHGKALVIVQSTEKSGSFTVTASSAGLPISRTTVYTTAPESGKQLLGYDLVSVKTKVGVQPSLPSTVNAVSRNENESIEEYPAAVTWDAIPEEQLLKAGIITVQGTAEQDGAKVKAYVEVVAPIGVRSVNVLTATNTIPKLPEQMQLVYSDATEESCAVTWPDIDISKVVTGAAIVVEGTLQDPNAVWKAPATIRVVDVESKNIALAVSGSEFPKFTASHTSDLDPITHVNDGIISYGTNPKNGWGNWKYAPIPEITTLDCEFAEPRNLNNISIHFREDGGIYIPADTLIQYWDGTKWKDVENQSRRSGFVSGKAEEITFDSVSAKKLRAQFTRGEQDTSGGKKDCLVLTEVEIYSEVLSEAEGTSEIETLSVGGEAVTLKPNKKNYTVTLPYGAKVPEIAATAKDHASVFILPAITNQSAAMIQVRSENGKNTTNYSVQFKETPAAVVSAKLKLEQETVKQDDLAAIKVDALLQSGEMATQDQLRVKYKVTNDSIPSKAEVKNGILYAYWDGEITITAEIKRNGVEGVVVSEPLTVEILKNPNSGKIVNYAKVVIDTTLGKEPKMPKTVKAAFDKGLPKDVLVNWDAIDPEKYNRYGTFTVNGSVDKHSLQPTAAVRVRDTLAAQNISLAVPIGVEPTLPDKLLVYYTDGVSTLSEVIWDTYDKKNLEKENTFILEGKTNLGGYKVTASIRVTKDTIESENHAKNRNGCPYSMAIASYSEGGSAITLNDGLPSKWTDWGNPTKTGDVWFGVIFGSDYPETRYVDSVVLELREDSEWDRTKMSSCTVEYYNGEITVDTVDKNKVANFDSKEMADHPFNNPENWTEVSNLKQPETYSYGKNTLTFDMVKAPAIRIKSKHQVQEQEYYFALHEIYAYGRDSKSFKDFKIKGITIDGKKLENFSEDKLHYEYAVSEKKIPKMSMEADSNASITFLPAPDINSEAKFIVTSEDGLKNKTYTVRLKENEEGGSAMPPKPAEPEDKDYKFIQTKISSEVLTGVEKEDGFFYSEDGRILKNTIVITKDGSKYIVDAAGKKYKKAVVSCADKTKYITSETGAFIVGKITVINGKRYYTTAGSGKIVTDKIFKLSGKKYIADETGAFIIGKITERNGKRYYTTAGSGKVVTNKLFKLNGKKYFADKTGKLAASKWVTIEKKKYYFNNDSILTRTK